MAAIALELHAMTAADNKRLMETIFAGVAAGDRTLFVDSLADDVTMTVTGQYSWSQTFRGRETVLRDLFGYVRSLLNYDPVHDMFRPKLNNDAHLISMEDVRRIDPLTHRVFERCIPIYTN